MHFASDLFDTNPRLAQLKSLLLSLFAAAPADGVHLSGLEHVISVSLGPLPPSPGGTDVLPPVHIRTYTTKFLASGTRVPRVELVPMGPFLDLSLRRHTEPDPELLKAALRKPKLAKTDVEKGLGKKRKNMEVDEMGDLRGRVHVAKQDLNKLQTRKMKGLKKGVEVPFGDEEESDDGGDEEGVITTKRRKT